MPWLDTLSEHLHIDTWVVQIIVVLWAMVLANSLQKRILSKLHQVAKRTRTLWDEAVIYAARRPVSYLIWVLGISFSCDIIGQHAGNKLFSAAITPLRDIFVISILTLFLIRLIHRMEKNLISRHQAEGKKFDKTTLDAIAKLLRLTVFIISSLVALQTLGFSISGVLAFGGIGGIAVGLAAKDMIANFFGGLTIYMDRPFDEGDWIRSPDREIEGTVERIGWRQTIIRTFDKRPLYVPNASFTSIAVENPSRMSNRRIHETLGIRYDDAKKMRIITDQIHQMISSHPEIDTEQTLIVNFNNFAPSSLDFFIYCHTKTTDWQEYHQVKEDVLLKSMDIILSQGAQCAFPTSTLHITNDLTNQPPLHKRNKERDAQLSDNN